jgi:leucyl-tRNA synthetase
MVCHETYKDSKGEWLYPEEVEINNNSAKKKKDNSDVIVGPSESMSKSKKNTIDPETMIMQYGADAVRWFILSDSPPEKDIQWSDTGVASSNKFLNKIWNLNDQAVKRVKTKINSEVNGKFDLEINNLVNKIDRSIDEFKFNVSIAHFYEIYKVFNKYINLEISNEVLINNVIKTMKLMIPFTPHLAYECLDKLNCTNQDKWPNIKKTDQDEIKFAIQVNGKTRDVISIKKNLGEKEVTKLVIEKSKAKKFIENKEILKTIFVKDKIMNYIIKL